MIGAYSYITEEKFETIIPDNAIFYRVKKEDGTQDFYLGSEKLNNTSDIEDKAAIFEEKINSIKETKGAPVIIQEDTPSDTNALWVY